MSIAAAFNDTISYYDTWIRKAVPGYGEMCRMALEVLPASSDVPPEILDLGAGTGLFSALVQSVYPSGCFTLVDVAEKMLDAARSRFDSSSGQFRYLVADYRFLDLQERYDLVISSLSIHHLSHSEKQLLFQSIFTALKPGGLFLNMDQIEGPTPALQDLYCRKWEEATRLNGASEEEIRGGLERRRLYDREATLEDQLHWLKQAGFEEVDCLYKNWLMGLFYSRKA